MMEMTPCKYHIVPGLFPYNLFLKGPLFHCENQHKRNLASDKINILSFLNFELIIFASF